jgi:hypothetical protein
LIAPESLHNQLLREAAFVTREKCVFLDSLYDQRGNATASMFPDETGYECFVNHVQLDGATGNDALLAALAVLDAVEAILAQDRSIQIHTTTYCFVRR